MFPKSERTYRIIRLKNDKCVVLSMRNKNMPILYDSLDDNEGSDDTEITSTDTEITNAK